MNGKRIYFILFPAIVVLLYCVVVDAVFVKFNSLAFQEKFLEKQIELNLMCDQIDEFVEADSEWETYDYERVLAHNIKNIDELPMTFAALYDNRFDNVSVRHESYEGSPFNPMLDEHFNAAIRNHESGIFILPFTPEGEPTRDMHIYYRWVPTDKNLSGRYLAVIAISELSVSNNIGTTMRTLNIIFGVIMVAMVIALSMFAIRLGYYYESRGLIDGEKWRKEGG